jgi:surface protein
MFYRATSFNGAISSWNTAAVTDTKEMFFGSKSFNGDISSWNTAAVTNMAGMFRYTGAFNGDLSSWDTSGVQDLYCSELNGNHEICTHKWKHWGMWELFNNAAAMVSFPSWANGDHCKGMPRCE